MNKTTILIDKHGRVRSGWRAGVFIFSFVFAAIILGIMGQLILRAVGIDALPGSPLFLATNGVLSLTPAIVLGWLCGKYFENLPFRALGASFTSGWLRHFLVGCLVGAATLGVAVAIAYFFGGLRFQFDAAPTADIVRSLAASFVVFALAAAFEEALCRGYFLQTFSRSGLAWLGIVITSLVFGLGHLGNTDANLISTINTVLAGIWFSVAYFKTRDLWFAWGMHLMWNWMQGSFFGIEVSGIKSIAAFPLFKEIDTGPQWLTGTTYGVEGGIVCTVALIVSTIAIYYLPIKSEPPALAGGS